MSVVTQEHGRLMLEPMAAALVLAFAIVGVIQFVSWAVGRAFSRWSGKKDER